VICAYSDLEDRAELTLFSFLGVVLYAVTAVLCLLAAITAHRAAHKTKHVVNWFAVLGFFLVLIALRGLLIEDWFEQTLRRIVRDGGGYAERRQYQAAAAVVFLGLLTFASFLIYRSFVRLRGWKDSLLFAVNMASAAMVVLIVLRVLSLHAIDMFLYRFKVNWTVDIGVTLFVGAAALFYVWYSRSRNHPAGRKTATSKTGSSIRNSKRGRPR